MPSQTAFWIDWLGFLWCGPLARGEYKRLEGVVPESMRIIWKVRDIGEAMPVDWCDLARARWAVRMFVQDAERRKR